MTAPRPSLSEGTAASSGGGPLPTTVALDHYFFHKVDDLYFRQDEATGQAIAVVRLGDESVSLPLSGIRREFSIPADSPDGVILGLLAKGLKYVKALRLGDPVPKEVLTGDASWEPMQKHRQIAYHRLAMQVLGWLSGDEHVITNPDELMQVAGDPTFRRQVNDAFGEAARSLGLRNKEEVTELIQGLSTELAYIEALRDEFSAIQRLRHRLEALRKLYANEHSVLETVNAVIRLMVFALDELMAQFETVDAQTGEIMSALKNLDTVRTYLRQHRDELRVRLLAWEDILLKWRDHAIKVNRATEDLISETYRFLAPRYMPVDEWVMMTRLQDPDKRQAPKSLELKKEKQVKYMGGRMSWS